jgi:hypothetical protein
MISQVPFMITQAMKQELRAQGLSDNEISNLTPEQAHERLKKSNGGDRQQRQPMLNGSVELRAAPDPATPELTLFVNAAGALTKQFKLDADGNLVKIEGGQMAAGTATRVAIANVQSLAELIGTMSSDQALALGSMRVDLPAQVIVTTKPVLNGRTFPGIISRSRDYLTFELEKRGFSLCDYDRKGITAEVEDKLAQSGGFVAALATVIPELTNTARVMRASTSAGLFRTDTGQRFADSGGIHLYLGVKDVSDSERFSKTLHDRCWLVGLGWYAISAAGTLLERSIVDRAVATPEHLCFEGPPPLGPGLAQDQAARSPEAVDGNWLDTRAVCPPLNALEQAQLKELQAKAAFALDAERVRVRTAWLAQRTTELATRCGITEQAARRIAIKHADGVLLPVVELTFANPAIGTVTVGDVLADPDKYIGEPLADPWEGPSYGRQTAKVLRRPDGSIFINSFAHGGQTFELKLDAEAIGKILAQTNASDVVDTMINHVLTGSLDAVEIDTLVRQAAELAGVGLRPVQQKLKAARLAHVLQQKAHARAARLMIRTDPRPRMPAPLDDAQWLPEMAALNDVLGNVGGRLPPARRLEGQLAEVQSIPVIGMHMFKTANEPDEDTPEQDQVDPSTGAEEETEIPPKQWIIKTLSKYESAEMIERYIEHYDTTSLDERPVQYPTNFVRHYMTRTDQVLPYLVAINTLPVVLGDGTLWAPDGLDRKYGTAFLIEPAVRELMPRYPSSKEDIAQMMKFLCDEWLVDVATNFTGKCVLLSSGMTIIERTLIEDRPVFFTTAGKRGTGKTTTQKMIIEAITNMAAIAAAWSPNDEERRKALMAYLMQGLLYILWDNIKRNTAITCPHIEKACTAAQYTDRKLGVSEPVIAAASTVNLFTGNNVHATSDLASRALEARLEATRVDMENRTFRHPDPLGWTREHRGKILQALFCIMVSNPELQKPVANIDTRFKTWHRLIGSALQYAAECAKGVIENTEDISFKDLFLKQDENDDDTAGLGEMLDILHRRWPGTSKAAEIVAFIKMHYHQYADADDAEDAEAMDASVIRSFLFPNLPANAEPAVKTFSTRLKGYKETPVHYNGEMLQLRTSEEPLTKITLFSVEKRPI